MRLVRSRAEPQAIDAVCSPSLFAIESAIRPARSGLFSRKDSVRAHPVATGLTIVRLRLLLAVIKHWYPHALS